MTKISSCQNSAVRDLKAQSAAGAVKASREANAQSSDAKKASAELATRAYGSYTTAHEVSLKHALLGGITELARP